MDASFASLPAREPTDKLSVLALMGDRARRVLGAMLYSLMLALPLTLLSMLGGHATRAEALAVGAAGVFVAVLTILFRRGHLNAVVAGLVLALLALGLATGATYGSPRGVGTLALVGAITVGGVFFGRWALVATVSASSAILGYLAWAQQQQRLPAPDFGVSVEVWIQYSIGLCAIALNIWFARSIMVDSLRTARDGEARLASIVRSTPAALIIASVADGRIQDINAAYERIFGFARGEAVGRSTTELGIWSLEQRAAYLLRLEAGGSVSAMPVQLRRRTGEVFEALISGEVIELDGQRMLVATITDVSAEAQARRDLQASELRYQALFHSSPVAMVVQDRDTGVIELVNAAAERIFGAQAEPVLGRAPGARYWADVGQQRALQERVARDGRCDPTRVRLRRANGEAFEALMSVETSTSGQQRQATYAMVDLSEELRLREQQRASDERFAKAFQSSPICMAITRLSDGVFLEVNDAVTPNFGYERTRMLGRTAVEVGLWPDQNDRQGMMRQLETAGRLMGFEATVRHHSGEIVDCRIYAERIELQGEPCMLAFTLNVTEARRRETQLTEAARGVSVATGEDFFRRLVEHLARATGAERANIGEIIDGAKRVRTVARFVDGKPADPIEYDLADSPCEQVLQRDEMIAWPQAVCDAFPKDEPLVRAGIQAYIGAPLIGVDGKPAGIMNVLSTKPLQGGEQLQDVFRIFVARAQAELARLQREREILALNEHLDRRVRERTAEVEQANRELEAFSYSVSHDLRAPLRGIDGFAQLVEERHAQGLTPEGRAYLQRVRAGTQRMGRLIDDLLSLSRVGRGELRLAPVNLSLLARSIATELARSQPSRKVQWQIDEGLVVQGDAGLLHIVLTNLLGNAFKYTAKVDEARVVLALAGRADGWLEFSIRDNGAGFDMAYADQLFQPFRRLHGQHEFEGTGVGLATVQRVLQRHGGSVRGEGKVGEGAVFHIRLPLAGASL